LSSSEDKKNTTNAYLFHGVDTFSSQKYLNFWKESFFKKYGENANLEEHNAKEVNIKSIKLNIDSVPFLCDKRLIIIKDFFSVKKTDDQRELAEIIENIPDHTIVIFYESKNAPKNLVLYKRLAKFGTVKEFAKTSPADAVKIIQETAKAKNSSIDSKTATFLFQYLDGNMWNVFHETEKLSAFTDEITTNVIEDNVIQSLNSSIFKLTDAIGAKDAHSSLKVFKTLLNNGESPIQIFFMIARNFRIIIQI